MYASSRSGVLDIAKAEGVVVAKRIEASEPDEVTEESLSIGAASSNGGEAPISSRQGFARPKRPGKR